jgi:hypothetical protein
MNIYADQKRIQLNSWNIGHGNKILHLLFLLNLADKWGAQPVVPCDSSLDDIFDLSAIKRDVPESEMGPCLYRETSAFPDLNYLQKALAKAHLFILTKGNLAAAVKGSAAQATQERAFLHSSPGADRGFISGHFWHQELMPTQEVFSRSVSLKRDLVEKCKLKYPDIDSEKSVMVHLRDTDFRHHLRHIFTKSIALPKSYYTQAIEQTEKTLGTDLTYHLFSDNPELITALFKGRDYILHNDDAPMDWVGLFLGKNVIQSNSSFCWTASLFNKRYSTQPVGGYNWGTPAQGSIPFGFMMAQSKEINAAEIR